MNKLMNKIVGLGDIAYWAFRPSVYAMDFIWGTDLKDCDVCKARRALWNSRFSAKLWKWLSSAIIISLFIAS
jgi:hypothetical protein